MKSNYSDIRDRLGVPLWYDSNGTPRYDTFDPEMCPNIYSNTVVLLSIACQACGEEFDVEMHSSHFAPIEHPHKLHYGDPPIHGCVGDTMNCEDLVVLQVWHKEFGEGWRRLEELEGKIDE